MQDDPEPNLDSPLGTATHKLLHNESSLVNLEPPEEVVQQQKTLLAQRISEGHEVSKEVQDDKEYLDILQKTL